MFRSTRLEVEQDFTLAALGDRLVEIFHDTVTALEHGVNLVFVQIGLQAFVDGGGVQFFQPLQQLVIY